MQQPFNIGFNFNKSICVEEGECQLSLASEIAGKKRRTDWSGGWYQVLQLNTPPPKKLKLSVKMSFPRNLSPSHPVKYLLIFFRSWDGGGGIDAKWPCRTCRCSWCNCYWNRWHFGQTWNLCQLSQMAFVEKYFWAEVKFRGLTQKYPFLKAEFKLEFSQTNWGALIIAQNLTICLK